MIIKTSDCVSLRLINSNKNSTVRLPGLQGSIGDGTPHAINTRSLWQHLAFIHLKRQSRFIHLTAARHLKQHKTPIEAIILKRQCDN